MNGTLKIDHITRRMGCKLTGDEVDRGQITKGPVSQGEEFILKATKSP